MKIELFGHCLGEADQTDDDGYEVAYEFYRGVKLNDVGKYMLKTTLDRVPVLVIDYKTGEYCFVDPNIDEEHSGKFIFSYMGSECS
jgi:exosome complex RNA-binding protein Rrp42 (RNase PH superfamily)